MGDATSLFHHVLGKRSRHESSAEDVGRAHAYIQQVVSRQQDPMAGAPPWAAAIIARLDGMDAHLDQILIVSAGTLLDVLAGRNKSGDACARVATSPTGTWAKP